MKKKLPKKSAAEVAEEIKEAIRGGVAKTLQREASGPHIVAKNAHPGVDNPPLGGGLSTRLARPYAAFRRKMIHDGQWQAVYEIFAKERFAQLFNSEFKRQERAACDPAQLTLPGFADLPRRIRVGPQTVPIAQITVGDLLKTAARYETSATRSSSMARELIRLADMLREQPPELNVREALARAEAGEAKTRAAK